LIFRQIRLREEYDSWSEIELKLATLAFHCHIPSWNFHTARNDWGMSLILDPPPPEPLNVDFAMKYVLSRSTQTYGYYAEVIRVEMHVIFVYLRFRVP
jgi:hypothetical protein